MESEREESRGTSFKELLALWLELEEEWGGVGDEPPDFGFLEGIWGVENR